MKKHTTWQDCCQVGCSLSGCYPDDYSVNAILILLPGCPVLNCESADVLVWVSPGTARLSSFGPRFHLTASSTYVRSLRGCQESVPLAHVLAQFARRASADGRTRTRKLLQTSAWCLQPHLLRPIIILNSSSSVWTLVQ